MREPFFNSRQKRWGLVSLFFLGVVFLWVARTPPPLKRGVALSHAVYDRHDRFLRLAVARDQKLRLWVPLENQSPLLIEATLLKEDRHFRWHPGINLWSLGRAVWSTYVRRERRLGASTITMQLARIRYKLETRSALGKLQQMLLALQLEFHYSKHDILEAYLNLAPYGGNIEGVAAASRIYFRKQPPQLTLSEAVALAVVPQKPGRATNRQAAIADWKKSFEELLDEWKRRHPKDASALRATFPSRSFDAEQLPFLAPHFSEAMIADHPEDSVLKTTLDVQFQSLLERQVERYLSSTRDQGINNAAAMILDCRSMDVLAAVGSADYFNAKIQGQVNGTRALRSPGSTLKPFVYALAMQQGLIHPLSMLKDSPASFGGFNPENFDGEFAGPLSATEALQRSRNVPAVSLSSKLLDPDLYDFLKQAGVDLPYDRGHYGMALVLGDAEVTMEDLIRMYAMLANKGKLKPIRFLENSPEEEGAQLLTPEACFLVLDMLASAPRPGVRYREEWTPSSVPIAWKTGTSYAFRDAWTMGIVGPYVIAVWIGNFDGEGNPSFVGGHAAAPLFFDVADALKLRPETQSYIAWPSLSTVKKVSVCAVSGQMPNDFCPTTSQTWIIPGLSPIEPCSIHRQVRIEKRTGFRACPDSDTPIRTEVFEFWPSDLLKIFRNAGIPRRIPPPFAPACRDTMQDYQGLPPKILSPKSGLIYNFRLRGAQSIRIPLSTVLDADVRSVYWFANKLYLGKAKASENLFWSPQPGRYLIRAVDDQGRADAVNVTVNAVN